MKVYIIVLILNLSLISYSNTFPRATKELYKLCPESETYVVEDDRYVLRDSTGIYYVKNLGILKTEPDFIKILIKKY